MARKIRMEYAGAVYHIVARGNQGRRIYADDLDRQWWLETLAEGCEQTGWRIHAYFAPTAQGDGRERGLGLVVESADDGAAALGERATGDG